MSTYPIFNIEQDSLKKPEMMKLKIYDIKLKNTIMKMYLKLLILITNIIKRNVKVYIKRKYC